MLRAFKKPAAILLTAAIILFSFNFVIAADYISKSEQAKTLLLGLGIIDKDEPDIPVTRGRFADVFARALNIHSYDYISPNPFNDTKESEYAPAIDVLHDTGYLNGIGNNSFAPEKIIRTEDIARAYICALGLGRYPESDGSTFLSAAYKLGLMKGVENASEIRMNDFLIMTYNFLVEAPVGMVNKITDNGQQSFTLNYNTNLLYENFKVKKIKGQITENSLSGIWSVSSLEQGYVRINSDGGTITVKDGDTGIANYLGYTLNIYIEYNDDSDNRVVCYEKASSNDTYVINIEDIDFDKSTLNRIEVSRDGRTGKVINVASFPSVIFNNVYYDEGTFNLNMLKNYEGEITLIKSSNTGSYDILNITAYNVCFIDNVEYYNGEMRIFDKSTGKNLFLKDDDDHNIEIYYPNGAAASIYELQSGMLLTVMNSADSRNTVIYISGEAINDKVKEIDADEKIIKTESGAEYKISPSCSLSDIEIGKSANIYLDHFGKIGWIEKDTNAGFSYAIVCSYKLINNDEVALKTYIKTNEFTMMTFGERVVIDGILRKSAEDQISALDEVKIKGFETGTFPMRYITDDNGKITTIDTPKYNLGIESEDSLRVILEKAKTTSGVLYSSDGILAKSMVMRSSAKVFSLPEDSAMLNNCDMFNVGGTSLLSVGKNSNVMAFQTENDSIYADLAVIWHDKSSYAEMNHDNRLFLIKKISKVYDEAEEQIVTEISGVEAGVERKYRTYSEFDDKDLSGLGEGDVVRFAYYKGKIYNVQVVFSKDPSGQYLGTYNQPAGANGVNNNEGNYDMYFCGYVKNRTGNYLKIWTADITSSGSNVLLEKNTLWKNDDTTSEEYRIVQAKNIAVYDPSLAKESRVYVGDIEDIPYYDGDGKYALVIARYRSRSPQEIIIIKQ